MDDEQETGDAVSAGVEAVNAERKRAEEAVEELRGECVRLSGKVEKVRADVAAAAAVREVAATEAAEIVRLALAERASEKAAMEKTYDFQTKKTLLNVGGVRFETSLPTLTSVPDTYHASIFSGRFPLFPDADGAYFIDRRGPLPPCPQLPVRPG